MNNVHKDVNTSAAQAYDQLAQTGINREDAYRIAVCFDVAQLMVQHLSEQDYPASHNVRVGPVEHSYVVINDPDGEETVADATWQQFIPHNKQSSDLPKVLIGSRGSVIALAHQFGVPASQAAALWGAGGVDMTADEVVRRNTQADAQADAVPIDRWMSFAR